MAPEKELRVVSQERVMAALKAYGRQQALALDLDMSDVELSRLLSHHLPKVCMLLGRLDLEVVRAGHIVDLRRVLKEVL